MFEGIVSGYTLNSLQNKDQNVPGAIPGLYAGHSRDGDYMHGHDEDMT
jgi:hypothetical protein